MLKSVIHEHESLLDCSRSTIFPCDGRCRRGSLNASEIGESTKCPWVGAVESTDGGKNRETVTDSLCLVFKGRGRNLAPPLIKSIPWRKSLSNQLALLTKSIQCSY